MKSQPKAPIAQRLADECLTLYRIMLDGCRQIELLRDNAFGPGVADRSVSELLEAKKETEVAVDRILASVEKLMATDCSDADSVRQAINVNCMAIYEACTFQDITGQRISKVLHSIRVAGAALESLHGLWSGSLVAGPSAAGLSSEADSLLNGPALSGEGLDQDEVNRLLTANVGR
ncbi:MAG: hypothetical protein P4L72_11860 [Parvibaculum sp.]|uniref:hypothetical protein n=1 Tax=Parvibaculum sp. TaxID=2024848 RepID=UPI0028410D5A|nr:hypothetical protein [Parvibaculum sp.]MDR3499908.1 hypothetical protein [Parvibaculum sp.]